MPSLETEAGARRVRATDGEARARHELVKAGSAEGARWRQAAPALLLDLRLQVVCVLVPRHDASLAQRSVARRVSEVQIRPVPPGPPRLRGPDAARDRLLQPRGAYVQPRDAYVQATPSRARSRTRDRERRDSLRIIRDAGLRGPESRSSIDGRSDRARPAFGHRAARRGRAREEERAGEQHETHAAHPTMRFGVVDAAPRREAVEIGAVC